MNTKSKKNVIAGLLLLVLMLACMAIAAVCMPTVVYADSAIPNAGFVYVNNYNFAVPTKLYYKNGESDTTTEAADYNAYYDPTTGILELKNYNGGCISVGGSVQSDIIIKLVGDNVINYEGQFAINNLNGGDITITADSDATLTINVSSSDYSAIGIACDYAENYPSCSRAITIGGKANVTVNATATSTDYIKKAAGIHTPGTVTIKDNASFKAVCKSSTPSPGLQSAVGIFGAQGVAINTTGKVDIDVSQCSGAYNYGIYGSASNCLTKVSEMTIKWKGSDGNGAPVLDVRSFDSAAETHAIYVDNINCVATYRYGSPLTFEDKAEYDVPATVYGGDGAYSSIALSASGGSGDYTFSIMSAADGNTSGVGISSNESDLNKIYVAPNLRGVSEATEITVKVTDKGGYSKTITVNIGAVAAPTYTATVDPVDFGTVRVGYGTQDAKSVIVTNTGTGKIWTTGVSVTLEGENTSAFYLGLNSVPSSVNAGSTMTNWYVRPNKDLPVGTYTATVKFTGTPEYSQYGGSSVVATATVKFVVTEHDFDTTIWEHDETKHWNPCKDDGCAVHGNEAAHDTEGELKNAVAATFDVDGYTGDKYCSVCGGLAEEGTVIPAGKYIRVSQATMTPAAITDKLTANDLVFESLDTSKYTVALWRVFDLTDNALNTDGGQYPKDSKFVADHEYAIEIKFTPVGSYVYHEMSDKYWSTFTVNGNATLLSAATTLGGSPLRRIVLVAQDTTIPVTVTDVQVDFASGETTVVRDGAYTFKATVSGTGAFDNTVTWSVEGGSAGTSISSDGVLTVAANETASTLIIKAVANGDSGKFATKTLDIYSKVTIKQGTGSEDLYKKAGESVSLTAIAAPSGYHFTGWTKTGEGTFADSTASSTDFVVSTSNVTIQSNFEMHSATSATWQSDGTRHWHVCSCGEEVDVAPHTPDRAEATETEPVKCSVCGYIITPALGHVTHTSDAEWHFDENKHWHVCTGCSQKLDEEAHTFGDWTITVQPEVGVAGEKERECSVCGHKEIAPVDALAEQITITVVGGKVNGGASVTVDRNGSVTVVAGEAPEGKTFKGWSADGGQTIISEEESYTFNATENVTLTAVYDDIVPGGEQSSGEQPEKTGLSGGAIAGIAVGSVAVVGLGGFSVFWFVIKKKKFADLIAIFKKK